MPKFLKNIFKFSNLKSSSVAESKAFLDKNGLATLLKKIATKLDILNNVYPVGIVIELKNDIKPNDVIGGAWKDITSMYSGLPSNVKKWQRGIPVNSDKTTLINFYNDNANLEEWQYFPDTWSNWIKARNEAKTVIDDPFATQEEVNNTAQALTVAFIMLRKDPNAKPPS